MQEPSQDDHFAVTAVTDGCAVCAQPRQSAHFFFDALGSREAIIGFDATQVVDGRSRVAGMYTTIHLAAQTFCSLECLRDYFLHKAAALESQIKQLARGAPQP